MAGRFVRASKYRHVFGRSTKKEQCYDNLRISKNAWDSNIIKANPHYIAVNWEASGGGAFAVVPIEEKGRLPELLPLFRGHTAAVLDTDWNPFDDSCIASGSDDGKVFIWKVPEGFSLYSDAEEPQDVSPVSKLTGHHRKVGHVLFNPAAANVLASSSGDYTIKLWDINSGAAKLTLKHNDIVQSMSWSANGSLMVTTCRDKKIRVWDVRQEKPAVEMPGHPGAKNSRAVWMGEHDRFATTGFSRMSDRQMGLWDIRAKEPTGGFTILDSISGVAMPFWDDGTQMLYVAGKGDGNIRYYEYEHDKFEYLSEYKSGDPQRGVAFLPKRGVNVHENEVTRAFKTVADSYIEPISFIVPRRAEMFQEDIYPPCVGTKPGVSADEWFSGKDAYPPKISMESIYEGQEPAEVAPTQKAATSFAAPTPAAAPAPAKTVTEPPKPQPSPALRSPPPDLKENKSMATMASKFADKEEESDDDDESSFEEIPKPVERPISSNLANRMEQKTSGPLISKEPEPAAPKPAPAVADPPTSTPTPVNVPSRTAAPAGQHKPTASVDGPKTAASGAAEGIKGYLSDIKNLLEGQNRVMEAQGAQIDALTKEVGSLKTKLAQQGDDGEKDARIRELELELEEARS